MMKRENAGLLGFLLALTAIGAPQADAAPTPASEGNALEGRLTRLTSTFRANEGYLQVTPTNDAVYVGYAFINSAPSFRNHVGGWLNRVAGWPNYGTFYNSGVKFLNNVPSFRNTYSGWPNHVAGWLNGGAFRNGAGFANGGGGFKNGAFANGGGFKNGGFANGGGGGFRNGGGGGFYNR
jgi:rSAM-associated Gly-rich repeat protein